jgi:hypothetical protein
MSRKFGNWEVSCSMQAEGEINRYGEGNSRFSQFFSEAPETKKIQIELQV